jgi:3-oxoacyl-(acyl-carrier-protein) synthase
VLEVLQNESTLVVITGLGIVSSIGNDTSAVLSSLKNHTSGIVFSEKLKEFNLRLF